MRLVFAGTPAVAVPALGAIAGSGPGLVGRGTPPDAPADPSGDLLERLATAGARLLVDVLDGIDAGVAEPVPQPAEGVTLAPKFTVADAEVRWGDPAFAVDRRIRACTPAPGAWTTLH